MCVQILANLVMETLHPQLRQLIGPRLKGKMQQRQRHWMLVSSLQTCCTNRHSRGSNQSKPVTPLTGCLLQISDAVYRQVLSQTTAQHDALVVACEAQRAPLDARLRTDMDQIISSKEHVSGKMRGDRKYTCKRLFFMVLKSWRNELHVTNDERRFHGVHSFSGCRLVLLKPCSATPQS